MAEDFVSFAAKGDSKKVREMLKEGMDPNTTDSIGRSALGVACRNGRKKVTKLLLEHGANPNIVITRDSRTCLETVCFNGDFEIAEMLVKHGADVNMKGPLRLGPLSQACLKAQAKIVHLLLKNGADPNTKYESTYVINIVITHLREEQEKLAMFAHYSGESDDDEEPLTEEDIIENIKDYLKIVKLLLEYGADYTKITELNSHHRGVRKIVRTFIMTNRAVRAALGHTKHGGLQKDIAAKILSYTFSKRKSKLRKSHNKRRRSRSSK
jgi:ankyrin repeat protein